ncbi:NAD-dependent epimerase/dehydratase family protein [Aureimonas sp. AU40]|uniref:NAD-dependent epimerase/dehydratase family protein n=1 Tax=Aureimonas sp. AU40 TaxID=1637747 RepID=UPI000785F178|nr:NAD-dependent epimerase/dehydratase family protein [Aureimonas sp. AU40]
MLQGETVLVTGCTGFIAKHIVLALVREGARVRGSLRDPARSVELQRLLQAAGLPVDRFESVRADLNREEGWREAVGGCRFVLHTASPFPASQPRAKFALVPEAKGGAVRVLEAAKAAHAERVVLTSSVASIFYGHEGERSKLFTDRDVSNVESESISPYAVSKTEAEKAAWQTLAGSGTELITINPSLVFGPLLDERLGTSATLVRLMMNGRMPAVPKISFGVVDVRDVAAAHVAALTHPAAAGRRFIVSGGALSLMDIADELRASFPQLARRMPKHLFPSTPIRLAARVSRRARMLAAELGDAKRLDTGPAREVLGMEFREPREAVRALGESLIRFGLVR